MGRAETVADDSPDTPDSERLRNQKDPRRRRLLALGLLARELAPLGIEPILVGGAALEFYTSGG